MTDSSLLNLSYHSAGKFATEPPSRAINMRTRITQPSGAATPEEADARCKRAHPFPPACCIIPRPTSHRAERDFEPVLGEFEQDSSAPKKEQEKGIGAFRANAYSQQPAVRAAARVCGFWKLTLFSRFPERFDAKFEKSRRKAPCHNGLRRRFDRKSVRFIPL